MEKADFDTSQQKAIKAVLTKKVVLIQGPPGTGKTFVGSHIVQMLLHSKNKFGTYRGPIFLVCYTNHALDQFLHKILKFTKKVVRMGGRSKDDQLKK